MQFKLIKIGVLHGILLFFQDNQPHPELERLQVSPAEKRLAFHRRFSMRRLRSVPKHIYVYCGYADTPETPRGAPRAAGNGPNLERVRRRAPPIPIGQAPRRRPMTRLRRDARRLGVNTPGRRSRAKATSSVHSRLSAALRHNIGLSKNNKN